MIKTVFAAEDKVLPDFMRESVFKLQGEILQSKSALSLSFFFKNTGLIIVSLGLLLLFFGLVLVLILRERRKNQTFRDQIRKNDSQLIKKALDDFYQTQKFYPSSPESKEFDLILKRAEQAKKSLPQEEELSFGQKILKQLLGQERYQKMVDLSFDTPQIRDPKKGQKVAGSDQIFDYYYSTSQLDIHALSQTKPQSYRLWCYLEEKSEQTKNEGISVYELSETKN